MQADADVRSLPREFVHQAPRGAHDEFEMRDVVALVRSDHQKFILLRRASMQSVAAVKHENLERGDPVFRDEILHLVDVAGFNRRDMKAVVDPEVFIGLPEHFGHELTIGAATIEVVMSGAQIVEARGNPSHCRSLALGNRILGQWSVYSDVHMSIDAARKRETIPSIKNLPGLLGLNLGSEPRDLSVLDRNIETIDRCLVRPNHAGILDDGIERLVHTRHSLP